MTARDVITLLVAIVLTAGSASVAGGAVRVVEDEVIFSLKAPNAGTVYIVGDFNNWNPTVEPLENIGDRWEISLFLVEGSYRYKFVVDGEWTIDPDNPGNPEKGSFIELVERAGGFALSTDEPGPLRAAPPVTPSVRYIGEFRFDEDDADGFQVADVFIDVERERLTASLNLQSVDESWRWDPAGAELVNGAWIELDLGRVRARGFETDSAWTSSGPVVLVGNSGVFDYPSGYGRHGVAFEFDPLETLAFRVLYADDVGDPAVFVEDVDPSSATPGSAAYAYADAFDGGDQLATEVVLDSGDFTLGYVRRGDRGVRPGRLAEVVDDVTRIYATRENRAVDLYWLRLDDVYGVGLDGAYGNGSIDVDRLTRLDAAVPAAGDTRILDSRRIIAGVSVARAAFAARASWDFLAFDYDGASGIYEESAADVHCARIEASYRGARWSLRADVRYSDADYGSTPAELYVASPARNPWLYGDDEFDVPAMVALGAGRYAEALVDASWAGDSAFVRPRLRARVSIVADEFFERLAHASARLDAHVSHRGRYYALATGRLSDYEGVAGPFASGWLEVGVRRGLLDVNVGYGFDPVVFDGDRGDYADYGYTRALRGALAGGLARDDGDSVRAGLADVESALESVNAIKLECIIRF